MVGGSRSGGHGMIHRQLGTAGMASVLSCISLAFEIEQYSLLLFNVLRDLLVDELFVARSY
jgi:hypothetical protein